jgi:TonB family protein
MVFSVKTILTKAARTVLVMAVILTAMSLPAQETRRVISNPVPVYPEVAKRLRLVGVVKIIVVVAPDGRIRETRVIGGHPLLVSSVEETLKNWKYAPAGAESTIQLEFNFHP